MQEDLGQDSDSGGPVVSVRAVEIGVALLILAFAMLVIISNYKLGAGWDSDGPQSGYFPFYVGIILFIAGAAILVQQFMRRARDGEVFVHRQPLKRILQVLIPTAIYAALIAYIGIYVSTAIFIAGFMMWLGRYRIVTAVPIALGISVVLFLTFEVWFLVPLPKGPLETWLGY